MSPWERVARGLSDPQRKTLLAIADGEATFDALSERTRGALGRKRLLSLDGVLTEFAAGVVRDVRALVKAGGT